MSTCFWLPSTGTSTGPTPLAGWGHVGPTSGASARPMNLTNLGSALTTLAYNPDGADHLVNVDSLIAQFVSDILPPQTIDSRDVFLNLLALEAASSNNLQLSWALRAFNVDVSSSLSELLAIGRNGVEVGTALTGASSRRSLSLTNINEPWRLVLEVGLGGTPTNLATDTHNGSLQFGEAPTSATVPAFPQHADTTTGGPPFLLFLQELKTAFDTEGAAFALGI